MNWIKKLFRAFKDEDSDLIEESIDRNEPIQIKRNKQGRESARKVEAKVMYQYPKGQFRFPLVPDREYNRPNVSAVSEESSPRREERKAAPVTPLRTRKKPRKVQRTIEKEPVDLQRKEKRTDFHSSRHEQAAVSHQPTSQAETRWSRPFAPAEIPSPIYGLRDRPDIKERDIKVVDSDLKPSDVRDTIQEEAAHTHREQEIDGSVEWVEVSTKANDVTSEVVQEQQSPDEREAVKELQSSTETEVVKELQSSDEMAVVQAQQVSDEIEVVKAQPNSGKTEAVQESQSPSESEVVQAQQVSDEIEVVKAQPNPDKTEAVRESQSPSESEVVQAPQVSDEIEVVKAQPNPDKTEAVQESQNPSESEVVQAQQVSDEIEVVKAQPNPDKTEAVRESQSSSESEVVQAPQVSDEIEVVQEQQNSDRAEVVKELEKSDEAIDPFGTMEEETEESTLQVEMESENSISSEHQIEVTDIQLESESVSAMDQSEERASIPFNVIMLKQDKQKLMQKTHPFSSKKEDGVTLFNKEEVQSERVVEPVQTSAKAIKETQEQRESLELQEQQKHESNQPKELEQEESYYTVNVERIDPDPELEPEPERLEEIHYTFPSMELLNPPVHMEENDDWITQQKELLNSTLKNFNVGAQVVNVTQGPAVTRFEVQPEPGVKVNKITNLSDDIKLSLAAKDIRIEAPIPGKHTIGIEVPNQKSRAVYIREIIDDPEFNKQESPLTAVLGLDISGKPIVTDLRKMPHGLIAGATGSGKSVCINTILVSLLYKATPNQLKLLLIDPKMVELAPYNHIPHLVSPVITDVKAATAALKWAVEEMERRYELFAHSGVRDISRFNELAEEHKQYANQLPYIVIVIDELADLMMMSPADVEEAISRIAQKARACGIHLIIATQRPSVDVITGLIKANIPTRIAFSVSSQIDSRTIIDISGAGKLLGKGDVLFLENGTSKPARIQGTFVSDSEIDEVVAHVRAQDEPEYLFQQEELLKKSQVEEEDELFFEACEFVVEHGGASTSLLQRRFKIGYNRAARLIDMMEFQGYISESKGSKPRDVYLTDADLVALHS